ncbi:unnamed protein product [Phaeothamnion confervicola]
MSVLDLTDAATVGVVDDADVTNCADPSWGMRVSVFNSATSATGDEGSAADVAAAQADAIQGDESAFFDKFAGALPSPADGETAATGADFALGGLGYFLAWTEGIAELNLSGSSTGDIGGGSSDTDVIKVAGMKIYWPPWIWAVYAAAVVICSCPVMFLLFRSEKEPEVCAIESPERATMLGRQGSFGPARKARRVAPRPGSYDSGVEGSIDAKSASSPPRPQTNPMHGAAAKVASFDVGSGSDSGFGSRSGGGGQSSGAGGRSSGGGRSSADEAVSPASSHSSVPALAVAMAVPAADRMMPPLHSTAA